ncbi:MAG: autotransporter assembly complex family protein [Gammaproteobacteria bacterium]
MNPWLRASILLCFLVISTNALAQRVTVTLDLPKISKQQKEKVLESIGLYTQRNSPFLTDDYIARLLQRGEQEIRTAMQVYGYYKITVDSKLKKNEDVWQATYKVDPGEPIKIRNVDVSVNGEGSGDEILKQWLANYPLHNGDTLNQLRYEQAKKSLQNILSERGYFKSRLTSHEIQVSMKQYYCNIVFHVDTGPRHRFGDVTFVQDTFDTSYLKRFVPFSKGEYFTGDGLSQLKKNLASSNEFQSVEIAPLVEAAENNIVPIRTTLIPRKPTRYTFGVGFGTDTGPRGRIGVERRRITNTGHKANADAFVSKVRFKLTANYSIPLAKPPYDYLLFSGERVIEDTDDTYSQSNTVSASTVYALKNWQRTLSLSYLSEIYTVSDEQRQSSLLIPGISFMYQPDDERDYSGLFDYRWRFTISAKGADKSIASDVSFVQSRLSLGNRFKLLPKFNLVTRVDVGWTWVENFDDLPVSQRFFAGGDQSIRGFNYNSIGPKDADGKVIGGDRLLVGSAELQYQYAQDKDVAVFYDAGNAYTGSQFTVENGVGVGMGWALPIGVLRVYLANAVSEPSNPWRLHVLVSADW